MNLRFIPDLHSFNLSTGNKCNPVRTENRFETTYYRLESTGNYTVSTYTLSYALADPNSLYLAFRTRLALEIDLRRRIDVR